MGKIRENHWESLDEYNENLYMYKLEKIDKIIVRGTRSLKVSLNEHRWRQLKGYRSGEFNSRHAP